MPRRNLTFVSGEFYHLFNRSIYRQPILTKKKDLSFFLDAIKYYTQVTPPVKFSYFRENPGKYKLDFKNKLVTIISYCLMPNHFHFSVRQETERGVQTFMQRVLNSFSHYHREKYQHRGPLFEAVFKAIHIETDEQLMHLSRYHHLNPVVACFVKHPKNYPYSSYQFYIRKDSDMVDPSYVLSHFSSSKAYEKFVLSRKDYQRKLEQIKHLIFA